MIVGDFLKMTFQRSKLTECPARLQIQGCARPTEKVLERRAILPSVLARTILLPRALAPGTVAPQRHGVATDGAEQQAGHGGQAGLQQVGQVGQARQLAGQAGHARRRQQQAGQQLAAGQARRAGLEQGRQGPGAAGGATPP